MHQLQIHCCNTFEDVIEKGVSIEKSLVEKGLVKIFKENHNNLNDKGKFWSRNENSTNDGVVDAKAVDKVHPTIHLKGRSTQNTPTPSQDQTTNAVQNNQQHRGPLRANMPKQTYTPLGEQIKSILKKLLQSNVIKLPEVKPYETTIFKPTWWNDNDFCEYHRTKGHKTSSCWTLKNLIQDLIEQGDMSMEIHKGRKMLTILFSRIPYKPMEKEKPPIQGTIQMPIPITLVSPMSILLITCKPLMAISLSLGYQEKSRMCCHHPKSSSDLARGCF